MSSKSPSYTLPPIEAKTPIDFVEKILDIYLIHGVKVGSVKKKLSPKLLRILSFYILYGYTKEAKKIIVDSMDITYPILNSANKELRDSGFLEDGDIYSKTNNVLNKDLSILGNNIPKLIEMMPSLKDKGVNELKLSININLTFP